MSKLGEFLLARADTHPEEFYEDRAGSVKHNWMHYIKQFKKFMPEEEYKAIWEKISVINLDYAMERVTEKLFEPEDGAVQTAAFGLGSAEALRAQQRYQLEQMKQLWIAQQEEMQRDLMRNKYKEAGAE